MVNFRSEDCEDEWSARCAWHAQWLHIIARSHPSHHNTAAKIHLSHSRGLDDDEALLQRWGMCDGKNFKLIFYFFFFMQISTHHFRNYNSSFFTINNNFPWDFPRVVSKLHRIKLIECVQCWLALVVMSLLPKAARWHKISRRRLPASVSPAQFSPLLFHMWEF